MPVDTTEAPAGYYAIAKTAARPASRTDNFCHYCDWRPECNRPGTDFERPEHRCADYAVITRDGREIQRRDRASVVFKRKAQETLFEDPS